MYSGELWIFPQTPICPYTNDYLMLPGMGPGHCSPKGRDDYMKFKDISPFPEGSTYKWAGKDMTWDEVVAKALTYSPEGTAIMPPGQLEVIKPEKDNSLREHWK